MQRRIFGIENEYGVTCTLRGQRRLSPDEVARYLFRKVVSWGRSSNVFLGNGSRLYLDVGSHPEYATPECDSAHDLVVHDKAGERIVERLLGDAEERLAEEGIRGDVFLFKNNTDSAGNSYGCHENYLTSRRDDLSDYAEVLIPFLVSRQIYAGAGKVLQTARGAMYCISQRAEHIWEGVSSATTRSRPIINTRDEPHADAERFRRLHVIVGDSNMSEYTTFLKVGACALMLRMLEDPPGGAARHDPGEPDQGHPRDQPRHHLPAPGAPRHRTRGQRARDPVGVPQPGPALRRASRPLRRGEEGPHHVGVLPDRHRAGSAHPRPRESTGSSSITWWRPTGTATTWNWPTPRVALVDLQYHDVSRSRGLYYRMQRRRMVETLVTDAEIQHAVENPPDTTRARLRGEFIRRAKERRRDYTVDWVHLKLNDQSQRTVLCKDPFKSQDERVEKLIASL